MRDKSLRQLAKATGLSPTYLSSLKKGKEAYPSSENVTKLVRALEIPKYEQELYYLAARHTDDDTVESKLLQGMDNIEDVSLELQESGRARRIWLVSEHVLEETEDPVVDRVTRTIQAHKTEYVYIQERKVTLTGVERLLQARLQPKQFETYVHGFLTQNAFLLRPPFILFELRNPDNCVGMYAKLLPPRGWPQLIYRMDDKDAYFHLNLLLTTLEMAKASKSTGHRQFKGPDNFDWSYEFP